MGERAANLHAAERIFLDLLEFHVGQQNVHGQALTKFNLGGLYRDFDQGSNSNHLNDSIGCFVECLKLVSQNSDSKLWAEAHEGLARAYINRASERESKDMENAAFHLREALKFFTPELMPGENFLPAVTLAGYHLEKREWKEAAYFYRLAIAADEWLYRNQLHESARRGALFLSTYASLYTGAAYSLAQVGELEEAVKIVEAGRAKNLRERLDRRRADLVRLQDFRFKDLYQRYMSTSQVMDNLLSFAEADKRPLDWQNQIEKAQKEFEEVIQEIRVQAGNYYPGFKYFLESLPFSEIRSVAESKPLVYIFSLGVGGMALVVTSSNVWAIPLDQLSDLKNWLGGRDTDTDTYLQDVFSGDKEKLKAQLEATTQWLWRSAMKPVVESLLANGFKAAVLIPCGMLSFLPLHAAGDENENGRIFALDSICFSYAPSARVLMEVAQQASSRSFDTLLAIDNPDDSLKYSDLETNAAMYHFRESDRVLLKSDQASLENVKQIIGNYDVVHFSTHGGTNLDEPLLSGLLMANGDVLTLKEVLSLNLPKTRLAILSACQMGVPVEWDIIDECVTLPTGFVQAGVPGVIAPLWSVSDLSTALLIARFYKLWKDERLSPPEALRGAQIWLRNASNSELKVFLEEDISKQNLQFVLYDSAQKLYALLRLKDEDKSFAPFSNPYWWAGFTYNGL